MQVAAADMINKLLVIDIGRPMAENKVLLVIKKKDHQKRKMRHRRKPLYQKPKSHVCLVAELLTLVSS